MFSGCSLVASAEQETIRNRESHDPTKAFDETAKILFVKVWVERVLKSKKQRKNIFNVDFLDSQVGDDPVNDLFAKTKEHYNKQALFSPSERINLRPETSKEIVRLLQKYNLSDTSEDIKGIAFERFLGRTFRGEIGQFFTPRPIVEFMIQMLNPQEGEVICDPASGSGGFLVRNLAISSSCQIPVPRSRNVGSSPALVPVSRRMVRRSSG